MAIPKSAVVIAALIALAGSGCTQPDPNAKPTYACTPSDGGTPQPCYKAEHDLQAKEDALYAEAEAVYRRFTAEDERIYRMGGIGEPTPELLALTTGEFLTDSMIIYRAWKQTKSRLVGGKIRTAWLKRAPESATPDSQVTMRDCRDASTARLVTPGERPVSAGYTSDVLHFTGEPGSLKISSALGKEVDKC